MIVIVFRILICGFKYLYEHGSVAPARLHDILRWPNVKWVSFSLFESGSMDQARDKAAEVIASMW